MNGRVIVVKAALDTEAGVWFVESSDLPGLCIEAETIEKLIDKLPAAVPIFLIAKKTARNTMCPSNSLRTPVHAQECGRTHSFQIWLITQNPFVSCCARMTAHSTARAGAITKCGSARTPPIRLRRQQNKIPSHSQ